MIKLYKKMVLVLAICAAAALAGVGYYGAVLPDQYIFEEGAPYTLQGDNCFSFRVLSGEDKPVAATGDDFFADITCLGVKIKSVHLTQKQTTTLGVSGKPFGVKMLTDGVIVVGITSIKGVNAGELAGLQIGDVLLSADGKPITGNDDLKALAAAGKSISVTFVRNGIQKTAVLTPVKDQNGSYKFGVWVRDSSAGIGTMTFVDLQNRQFGGLGHGITDTDTGQILPLQSGVAVQASIDGVQKGKTGTPGQLKGTFYSDLMIGPVQSNTACGLFGRLTGDLSGVTPYQTAPLSAIKRGDAQILSTVEGDTPKLYNIKILSVNYNKNKPGKNMVIRVTDKDLLAKTGGIVQGMSGSPIIQDGKLVGAVTHVLVNNPTRGYGIFIENMLEAAE